MGKWKREDRLKEKKTVRLEMTALEWEVINQALHCPIKHCLKQQINDLGIQATDGEVEKAWGNIMQKWSDTY